MPLRRIALLTLLAFGCATVRVPATVSPAEPADGAGVIAPPIVELWIESSDSVPPQVASNLDTQARFALDDALSRREIRSDAAGATDAVLFVRERAVALTEERHSQQTWAKVGIAAAIVVVVAAVVILAVSGSKGSNSSSVAKAPKVTTPKAAPVAVKPRVVPAASAPKVASNTGRVVPLPGYPGPRYAPRYYPRYYPTYYGHSPLFIGFYFDFWIPPRPLVLAPEPEPEPWYPADAPIPYASDAAPGDLADLSEPPPPDADSEAVAGVALQLPPLTWPATFKVNDRSFFAGPQTAIQLDLLDRATGALLWSKAVIDDADPTDAKQVAALVDKAFAGQDWARRSR